MTSDVIRWLFVAILLTAAGVRWWLAARQMRHVAAHRDAVPAPFAERIDLDAHRKAADYALAKGHFGQAHLLIDLALVAALTIGGGVALIDLAIDGAISSPLWRELALPVAVVALSTLVDLPMEAYRTFVIETRFGFNRSTWRLWLTDRLKGAAIGAAVGVPLLAAALSVMQWAGPWWWLAAWAVWLTANLIALLIYPTVIAPLFNRFVPLPEGPIAERVRALLDRCRFQVSGLYVMDGSRRSAHGNAYFTGIGKSRRIVFFDTLLDGLAPDEVEAVLAHELGHYARRHIRKRLFVVGTGSLLLLWAVSAVMDHPAFLAGVGMPPVTASVNLLCLMLVVPPFLLPLTPLLAWYSRRHEYEADAYAARQSNASSLASALVKLYRDNAATLTPDPVHSRFYDTHPPALARIARLRGQSPA